MDILLLLAGIVCLLVGLAGAVLPLPGPPLSYAGLILLHISKFAEFGKPVLITLGIFTAVIAVLDYYIPIWGTKKFGGTRYGAVGATVGLLAGFFYTAGYRDIRRNLCRCPDRGTVRRLWRKRCLPIGSGFICGFYNRNRDESPALPGDDRLCCGRDVGEILTETFVFFRIPCG